MDPWETYERLAASEPSALSPAERSLVAIGGLRTEVNNGGFEQYFANSAGDLVDDAVQAASTAGAPALATIVRRAVEVLGAADPADRGAREAALDGLDVEAFEALDEEFYALEGSVDLDDVMRAFVT